MLSRTSRKLALVLLSSPAIATVGMMCPAGEAQEATPKTAPPILRSPETQAALEYQFSAEDEALLTEIQRGCFEFLWKEVGDPVPLVKDRLTNEKVSSLAGVGFQLSAIPIGVERGWITKEQGQERARAILRAIIERDDNKKFGIYLHYVDLNTGGMHDDPGLQVQASTVDHALLQAGAMTVGVYFGGDVAELADKLVADANWKIYQVEPDGFVSFGWRPDDEGNNLDAPGAFRPWTWYKASAEEQLVSFLAVGAPNERYSIPPEIYYAMHRVIKQHKDMPPFAVSWNSSAFTYFFSHCWIDYRDMKADNPAAFGVELPAVDWLENSRRAMLTHRQRCLEAADQYKTFAPNRWGLSPAADYDESGKMGYIVPSLRPCMEDADNFCGGTVTPYAAGSSIMFMPKLAVDALREFRNLKDEAGNSIVWAGIGERRYGLLDSFNLDREKNQGTLDYLSIDDGPMILAIENARTGLIWDLFMKHPAAQRAVERLRFQRRDAD